MVEELQRVQRGVGTEVTISHQDVPRAEGGPQVVEELVFTDGVRGGGLLQESPGFEAENAHHPHQRETATGLLVLGLRAELAVGGRVGKVEASAVDDLEGALARDPGKEVCLRGALGPGPERGGCRLTPGRSSGRAPGSRHWCRKRSSGDGAGFGSRSGFDRRRCDRRSPDPRSDPERPGR